MAENNTNYTLAIVARDPNGADGKAYTGYQVPNTGEYIITCKQQQVYTYMHCLNEQVFYTSWEERDNMHFSDQATAGLDLSIVTLQDAILEANEAARTTDERIVSNQQANITSDQEQTRLLQQLNDRLPYQANGRVPVSIEGPITLTGDMNMVAFPEQQHVYVDNPTTEVAITGKVLADIQNFPEVQHVVVDNTPTIQAVSGSVSIENLPAVQHVVVDNQPTTQAISGSVTVANQPTTYPVTGTFWQQTQPVSGAFWPETQPISGSVAVSNFPAFPTTQAVSGSVTISNLPATQAVSGPLTDTQLRSSPIPVSVSFPANQQVSGTVNIGNFPGSQHVTVDNPVTSVNVLNQPSSYPVTGTVTIANPTTTVAVSSLPAGFGTSANQLIANTSLASVDTKLTTISTAALQTAGNTSLSSIDSKLTSPLSVKVLPASSGGLAGKVVVASAIGTTPTVVKASSGQVYDIVITNLSGSAVLLNMYNKATTPGAGDIPVQIYGCPANQSVQYSFPLGSAYSTGISFTLTSNVAILGILTGLLSANQLLVNLEYA